MMNDRRVTGIHLLTLIFLEIEGAPLRDTLPFSSTSHRIALYLHF